MSRKKPIFHAKSRNRHRFLPFLGWAIVTKSLVVLATVYIAQYGFGLIPCELCLKQRIPWIAALLLSLVAIILHRLNLVKISRLIYWLIAIVFLSSLILAAYHSGVEFRWWQGPSACSNNGATNSATTIEELRAALMASPVVLCDQPAWSFYGLTLASLNFLASVWMEIFILALLAL